MEERNDIVIHKSEDGLVKMEAMVDPVNETIWASQKAFSALFGCTKQNVSYHMGKIFASGELERTAVVKVIMITAQSGARGLSEDESGCDHFRRQQDQLPTCHKIQDMVYVNHQGIYASRLRHQP